MKKVQTECEKFYVTTFDKEMMKIREKKFFLGNDYIKNIICYYSSDLTNKEKDIIHNKIVKLFLNIRDICIDNNNMKLIMGYLMLILIENK